MRIISGTRRGQKLLDFDGYNIRPTTDRVRESMFNLIFDYVSDAKVLDLFGGSGALSLEALSRGAKSSVICDIDKRSLSLISENTKRLRFEALVSINNIDATQFLKTCKEKFDIVFLDPPYNKGFISPIIKLISENQILNDDGIIVLESDFPDEHGEFDGLELIKQRRYGRSYVTIYQRGDRL